MADSEEVSCTLENPPKSVFSCEPKENKISVVPGCICPLYVRQLWVWVWEAVVNKACYALPVNEYSLAGNRVHGLQSGLCVCLGLWAAFPSPVSFIPWKCGYRTERLAGRLPPRLLTHTPRRAHTRMHTHSCPFSLPPLLFASCYFYQSSRIAGKTQDSPFHHLLELLESDHLENGGCNTREQSAV